MKMTFLNLPKLGLAALFMIGSAHSATILVDDDFENGINSDGAGSISDFFTANVGTVARTGYTVAFEGSKGALLRAVSGISLINPLLLDTGGYTSVTIDFQLQFAGGTRTPIGNTQVYYSALGNFTDSVTIGDYAPADAGIWNARSISINDGSGGINFTDTAKIRFVTLDTNSADWTHLDNVVITGIPEPSSALLVSLGLLCLLRRQRC